MKLTHCPLCGAQLTNFNHQIFCSKTAILRLEDGDKEIIHCKLEYSSNDELDFGRLITNKYVIYHDAFINETIIHPNIIGCKIITLPFLGLNFSSEEELDQKIDLYLLFS
jgi:hypothetical protein